MDDLTRLIRRRRVELQLTQRAAAERAGVSLATWQALERPTTNPDSFTELTLSRAAHGLGLDLSAVLRAAGRDLADPATSAAPVGAAADVAPDADMLVADLIAQLRALHEHSADGFLLVCGQALDTTSHLLSLHRPT